MILSDHRETIVREILAERARQATLHPADEAGELDCFVMLAALTEEVGEANQAALKMREALMTNGADHLVLIDRDLSFRAELVQVAAVAFKMLEAHSQDRLIIHDRREAEVGGQMSEVGESEIGSPS